VGDISSSNIMLKKLCCRWHLGLKGEKHGVGTPQFVRELQDKKNGLPLLLQIDIWKWMYI
jgi:hypothetical protein